MTIGENADELEVEATFARGVLDDGTEVSVTEGAEPFVRGLTSSSGAIVDRKGAWFVPGCASGCTLHYRFALKDAGARLRSDEVANTIGAAREAPPGAWLVRPMAIREGDQFRLAVRGTAGTSFASGLARVAAPAGPATGSEGETVYGGNVRDVGRSPYSVFGVLRTYPIVIGTVGESGTLGPAHLTLAITLGSRPLGRSTSGASRSRASGAASAKAAAADESDKALVAWAERGGNAIAKTFGHFPIDGAMVGVLPGRRGGRVGFGRALAGPLGGSVLVDLGADVSDESLESDWVLVHEMIHLAFPSLDRRHRWMEEGLATYLEPFVRARAGMVEATEVWGDFLRMLPNGLPDAGDKGLDQTPTWGRVYWGGALFCMVVDVEIRKRSHGRHSLDDALRAILDAGGNNGQLWTIERTFATGDAALGPNESDHVLTSTYNAWKDAPVPVDLDALFKSLGVLPPAADGEPVRFDDSAPLAEIRRAMTVAR